jgi:MFS family permease
MNAPTSIKSSRLIDATPFFYGWVILAVGTISIIMMGPSQTFTVGIFTDYFITELNITRANISLIYGLATLGGSLLLPITGKLVDRYGPQRMVLGAALTLGLACIDMALVHGVVSIFIGFLALRFAGFGSLQLVSNNVVAQWFIRRRGLVMGLAGQSLAVSLIVYPSLAEYLINRFDWRSAYVVLGLLVWIIVLPLGWFFVKDKPELYGLLPDGDQQTISPGSRPYISEENWTLEEARRTSAFWIFAAALATMTMLMAGLIFHQLSLFEQRGLSREAAILAFNAIAIASIAGNFGMGYLLDNYSARLLLALTLSLLVGALILVQVMTTPGQALLYGVLLGLSSGAYKVIDSVIWAKYYGRLHLGSIKGATMLGLVGASAFGPYPLGLSLDYLGSYAPVLTGLLILPVSIGFASLLIKRPEKR